MPCSPPPPYTIKELTMPSYTMEEPAMCPYTKYTKKDPIIPSYTMDLVMPPQSQPCRR